jgi:small GTP-binding protein
VRSTTSRGSLLRAIDELTRLAGSADQAKLAGLAERLRGARLRVLVVGEAKRGKSTLVNALLGRDMLPSGVTPLTALATTVTYGAEEGVTAVFADGHTEQLPLSSLGDLVTERGNPANRRAVDSVTVRVDAPVLARGVEIVDTPGTGSVYAHNTAAAAGALETLDAAVFVLTADPPVSAAEKELLAQVGDLSVRTFVVLNKADYLDAAGLAEALEFTGQVVRETTRHEEVIYPLSARAVLSGADDEGFAAFAADFTKYLEHGGPADLDRAVAGHLRRIAASLLDEVTLTRRAAQMRTGEAAQRVEAFRDRLAAVGARRQDAVDLAAAESKRLLGQLNDAAERAVPALYAQHRALVEGLLDGELRSAPPGQIERDGRDRLAAHTRESAERWRQEQREMLEQGLEKLGTRLTADLAAELASVRDCAAELLGIELAMPAATQRLAPDLSFFYNLAEDAGQTELLAGAVRRRLPGELGRRLARDYLLREARNLADSQTGRARADLQYRLEEATRRLIDTVGQRYAESTAHLSAALDTAAALRAETAAEAARRENELAEREAVLEAVLAELG